MALGGMRRDAPSRKRFARVREVNFIAGEDLCYAASCVRAKFHARALDASAKLGRRRGELRDERSGREFQIAQLLVRFSTARVPSRKATASSPPKWRR